MIPEKENFILANKLVIYNNFAEINEWTGRLFAELQVYPIPRILWDFEILGENVNQFGNFFTDTNEQGLLKDFFLGYFLEVELLKLGEIHFGVDISSKATGSAFRCYLDDPQAEAHTFYFCLTNTRFQRVFHCNVLEENCEGGIIEEIPLNSIWAVRLEIDKKACKWLDIRKDNIGVHLTGLGTLSQLKVNDEMQDFPKSLTTFTIIEAQEILENLCLLLSYANGGFVAPIFIEGEKYNKYELEDIDLENQNFIGTETTSKLISTGYQFTSLEQLGESWLTEDSNLENFISCFSNFEKMLDKPFWKDTFYFVLVQYFQAISSKNWELAASATGAALERLSHAILVEDETDPMRRVDFENLFSRDRRLRDSANQRLGRGTNVTATRLRLLLERIGLNTDETQEVRNFLDVRNDSVHSRVSGMIQNQRWQLIRRGIQWIDEVLLWRLGYEGKYLDRIAGFAVELRYDLSLRAPCEKETYPC